MTVSVNLLQEAQQMRTRLRRAGLAIQSASIVVLVAIGLLVFFLLSYTLILARQEKRLAEDILEQEEIIESMRSLENKQFLIKQKLSLAHLVVREPSLKQDLVSRLYLFLAERATVSEVRTQWGDPFVNFTGLSGDVFSLVNLLNDLTGFSEEEEVERVVGNSFFRTQEEGYQFQITFEFEEG
jgi:hypothetical protein